MLGIQKQEIHYSQECLKNQVDEDIIKDSIERTDVSLYVDASVVESINFGYVNSSSPYTNGTIKAFDEYLSMKNRSIGNFISNSK